MKFIVFLLFFISQSICAEVYKDFAPFTTLATIKKNYPNANFEVVKAAWVKENDLFLEITGSGLSGTTYVATSKRSDSEVKETIDRLKKRLDLDPSLNNDAWNNLIESEEKYLVAPDDEKYTIDWLRWVPNLPLPIERLISKFGEPDIYDFQEEDFQPYAQWVKRGLLARLSDDKKRVFSIQYSFSEDDYNSALGIKPSATSVKDNSKVQKKSKTKAQ